MVWCGNAGVMPLGKGERNMFKKLFLSAMLFTLFLLQSSYSSVNCLNDCGAKINGSWTTSFPPGQRATAYAALAGTQAGCDACYSSTSSTIYTCKGTGHLISYSGSLSPTMFKCSGYKCHGYITSSPSYVLCSFCPVGSYNPTDYGMRYCLACPAGYTTSGTGASSCSVKCPGYDYTATWETSSCTAGSSCTNVCTPKTCKGGAKIIDGVCKEYGETFNNNGVYVTNDSGSVCLVCNGMYDDTSSNDQYIYSGSHAPGLVGTTLCNTVRNYNINETYGSRTCTSSGWDMTGATYRQYYWKTYTGNIQVMYYKDYTNGTAGTETRLNVGGNAYNSNGWLVRCKPGYKLSITTSGANYVTRQTDTIKEVWSKSAPSTSYITCTSCPTGTTFEDDYCHAGGTSAEYVDGAMVREYKKSTDRPRESCSSNSTGNMYCGWGYYGTPTWHSSLAEYYGCYECPSAWQRNVQASSTSSPVSSCLAKGTSSYLCEYGSGDQYAVCSIPGNNTSITSCYVPSTDSEIYWQQHHGPGVTPYMLTFEDDTGTFTTTSDCYYSTTATSTYSTICPAE